jgi:hypothetical protein
MGGGGVKFFMYEYKKRYVTVRQKILYTEDIMRRVVVLFLRKGTALYYTVLSPIYI